MPVMRYCHALLSFIDRKWLKSVQSHRKKSGVPPALQRTWASSADGVCSDRSYMLLQCGHSSPAYCSCELPGTCKMSPLQCSFPACSLVWYFSCGLLAGRLDVRTMWTVPTPGMVQFFHLYCFSSSVFLLLPFDVGNGGASLSTIVYSTL